MDKLNPKIWNEDFTINQQVRKNLLQIANDFIKFTKIKNLKIVDIVLTGSMANYNWHSKSDIDLHIIFDLSNFKKNERFVDEYLQTKKALWNKEHEIEIYGFKVEVYPENKAKNQKANGIFSLIKNEWIVKPVKTSDKNIDKDLIRKKYQNEVDKILRIESEAKRKDFDYIKIINDIDKYKENLREKRSAAIREQGELAVENIVFKMLRNNGFLDRLSKLKKELYDNALTLERFRSNIVEYTFSKGDKFVLNKESAKMHGRQNDRFKIISDSIIKEGNLYQKIRNLRTRKDYLIEVDLLKLFINKNYLTVKKR